MSRELFDTSGNRKYLTEKERALILKTAERSEREVRTFIGVLLYTGCRISEALELTTDRIDMSEGVITFESLKKRKRGVYRSVPVPPKLLDELELVHSIRETERNRKRGKKVHLWDWSRATAWRRVKEVLDEAGVGEGPAASPKGLRHGFGVAAVSAGIPLNLLQKWLGHAQLSTTAIYADAVGAEEKNIAARMW
jgi:integrase/recombinase XerD